MSDETNKPEEKADDGWTAFRESAIKHYEKHKDNIPDIWSKIPPFRFDVPGKGFIGDATEWIKNCDGVTGSIPTSWNSCPLDLDIIGERPIGATVTYSAKRLPRKLKKRLKNL